MTWVKAKDISSKYAIPLPTVYYYVKEGVIPANRIAGRWKFPLETIDKIFKKDMNANTKVW